MQCRAERKKNNWCDNHCGLKKMVKSITFNLSMVTGSTACEAKKKAKCTGNIIDAISAVNDVFKKE